MVEARAGQSGARCGGSESQCCDYGEQDALGGFHFHSLFGRWSGSEWLALMPAKAGVAVAAASPAVANTARTIRLVVFNSVLHP
jgi:hypothetical protein